MGTVLEFPADAARRSGSSALPLRGHLAEVVILPVIRIERHDTPQADRGPEQGAAPPRRRRRRTPS